MYSYLPLLAKMTLSENDKRLLICLLILIILIVIIFGYLQKLVGYIMKIQGLQIDTMMFDIMRTRVIVTKKEFRKEAFYKSRVYFLKKAWIPFAMVGVFGIILVIYAAAAHNMDFSFFNKAWYDMSFSFNDISTVRVLNMTLIQDWPTIKKASDFSWSIDKYVSLSLTLAALVSSIAYLVQCQALLSRSLRIFQLGHTYFSKDLNKTSADHAN
jgi:hypothetical protein